MIALLIYLIKATIISGLFYLCYKSFFADRLQSSWARAYLLLSLLLPVVLPFIQLQIGYTGQLPLSSPMIRQVIVGRTDHLHQRPDLTNVLLAGYALISCILVLGSLVQYIRFYYFLRRCPFYYYNRRRVYQNTGIGPGSLLKVIFIPDREIDIAILDHEAAHISYYHWMDLLAARVLQCIFWPNIFNHLILRELKLTHECEADAAAVKRADRTKDEYAALLLNTHFGTQQYSIANSFTHHPLKRRIVMLHKRTTRATKVTNAVFATAILLSCSGLSVLAQNGHSKRATGKSGHKTIYQQVDQQPEFKGDLGEFLSGNLQYPEKARQAGKQGKVYTQFVVNKNGNVSDVKVLRSSGTKELDVEAVRVVRSMPAWKPGKVKGKDVACSFVVPIVFALDN